MCILYNDRMAREDKCKKFKVHKCITMLPVIKFLFKICSDIIEEVCIINHLKFNSW